MRRMGSFVLLLAVFAAGEAQAQQCRRYAGGTVVVCDRNRGPERGRDRVRERDHREWGRPPVELGVRGGWDFDGGQGSIGTQLRVPVIRPFAVAPSFDAFFGDEGASWQLNLDGQIRPMALGGLYFGGGGARIRREFDVLAGNETKVGWNALLGIDGGRVARTTLRPFAEGRWSGAGDFHAFRLVAGVNVPIGMFGMR